MWRYVELFSGILPCLSHIRPCLSTGLSSLSFAGWPGITTAAEINNIFSWTSPPMKIKNLFSPSGSGIRGRPRKWSAKKGRTVGGGGIWSNKEKFFHFIWEDMRKRANILLFPGLNNTIPIHFWLHETYSPKIWVFHLTVCLGFPLGWRRSGFFWLVL